MDRSVHESAEFFAKRHKSRKIFRKIIRVMGCVVAFVTTYALILPAITLEKPTFCGMEEHTHEEVCYQQSVEMRVLVCDEGEKLHVHNEACFNENGSVICGLADYLVHSHAADCWNSDGELVCPLPEHQQHVHKEACYMMPDAQPHIHTDSCSIFVQGVQICVLEECDDHEHRDDCYVTETVCNIPEGHIHDVSCYKATLLCGLEGETHTHTETCYSELKELCCSLEENHSHGDLCYYRELICESQESGGHIHDDMCYQWIQEYVCGMQAGQPEVIVPELVCAEPVADVHVHGEKCFQVHLTEPEPVCAEEHEHTYTCFQLICTLAEHTHSLQCYSDHEADVESRMKWESTMKKVEMTGDWSLDVIAIAESQLGYKESSRNYVVEEDGTTRGYTRYGDWYGIPYGDWCGMFASFCLRYAGVDEIPINSGVQRWIVDLSQPETDLYRTAEEYTPIAGDLVFFDWDHDGNCDHVGFACEIVEATENRKAQLKTIEGNSDNRVRIGTYDLDDPDLLGYGMLPENPDLNYICGYKKHVHNKRDCFDKDMLICDRTVHIHNEECTVDQINETEQNTYYCGLDTHEHTEDCNDAEGNPICQKIRHQHEENCLVEIVTEPTYYCGVEVHVHTEGCVDEAGGIACELTVHEHSEDCLTELLPDPVYYCGQKEHTHVERCYHEDGSLSCEEFEHLHEERCAWPPMMAPPVVSIYCGMDDHIHTDSCWDAAGGLICGTNEHSHTSLCLVDLEDLDGSSRENVGYVIALIDDIPTAEELVAKSEELAEAGDADAEEAWIEEIYQKIGLAYSRYVSLTEELQSRVVNRDKLLELEFVWSRMPLATFYIWLDGTNGGMMSLYGSDNALQTLMTAQNSYQYKLPTTWKSPSKYSYTLRGWYDIYGKTYYQPGETVTITRNTVFYADWEAASYNIGQFNANVVDAVSTDEFVTIRMFDYSGIFNMYSTSMHSNYVRRDGHAESWNALAKGVQLSDGSRSLGIILRDWDTNGSKQNSYPSNFDDSNNPQFNTSDYVTSGLYYSYNMYDLFFNPNSQYMGKEYLGTADYLFQYEKDPNSPYYGYYYYDSARNAASYNQSNGRFYVYDYLERTTTSKDNNKDSDFLPFNSPYINNPQGHRPTPETSASGQPIYTYSSSDGNSGMTGTNFWFGMSTEIRFYLPNQPGTRDASGEYGNQSTYGQDMEFRFSGDDDVYVLVDNSLVLDIGGIHDIKSGTINFSTGVVTVEGGEQTDKTAIVKSLPPGEHTLTLLYMERGSSMSNCSIYFNISPRFTLSIQKEDLFSNVLLNGAEFQIFMDPECRIPAKLWTSYQHYREDPNNTTNVIVVKNDKASLWGFAAGNTYYIKETKPPDKQGYVIPNGLIKMELSNKGVASYTALVIPDPTDNGEDPTPGFRVEGFRIDEENHVAYLIVNNSVAEGETTSVFVQKVWEGSERTPVTVYLMADGKRIQEVVLNAANNWKHTWDDLPKYQSVIPPGEEAPQQVEITYTVEEGIIPGYIGTIEAIKGNVVTTSSWEQANSLSLNETYILKSNFGCLATTSNGGLAWISETEARGSPGAQWKVESQSGTTVSLKNDAGYYLCNQMVGYSDGESYFYGSKNPGTVLFVNSRIREPGNYTRYLHSTIDSNGHIPGRYDDYNAVQFTLYRRTVEASEEAINGLGFKITNRPVKEEDKTSLTVTKIWTDRDGKTIFPDESLYETANVTVKLQANGVDTGQTAKLNLKSQWKHTFTGLPRKDASGNTIDYTVVETWYNEDWKPQYSDLIVGQNGSYSIQINNVYDHRINIPVIKCWDESIHNLDEEKVLIQLYAVSDDNMGGTLVGSITLTADTDWQGVLRAIPPDVENVSYYIYEQTEKFAPEYSTPAKIFINGVSRRVSRVEFNPTTGDAETTVVTNRPLLELPETGGSALLLYTAGSMLTTTAAVHLLYQKRTKRRRGEEEPSDA